MDNYNKVERLLYNYKMLEINIKNMQEEISFIEENDGVTAINYDSQPSNTNKINSIVENTTLSIIEKREYLEQQIEGYQRQLNLVDKTLEGLTDTERTIIEQRYIQGEQWYVVANMVCYNDRWCKELRKRAINKMAVGIYGDKALIKHENK